MSELRFQSRRPVIVVPNAAVAAGQPQAVQIGLDILTQGGNAADAAVAIAAAMNVTQPISTGLGGDAFCLYYDAATKAVQGLNGSGRAPAGLTLDRLLQDGFNSSKPLPAQHGYSVTVPGAAAAWVDTVKNFGSGKLSLSEILQPAVVLAEQGFPVTEIAAHFWNKGLPLLLQSKNPHGTDMCINGRAPKWGEMFRNQHLADTYKVLGKEGKKGFYEGRIAEAIVDAVKMNGGDMTTDDLQNHRSTLVEPISTEYKGVRLWEIPPNGQGIVALMALNILKTLDVGELGHNTAEYLHTLVEALRLAFNDAMKCVADPSAVPVPITAMLSEEYASKRRELFDENKAIQDFPDAGKLPAAGSDTVYFTVVDSQGNACSFINSNYMGFGTGIVPKGCGFTLQNRGCNFSLDKDHPNCVAPNKRPFHTIIPAMLTDDKTGELRCSYGVMGGFMQPQGHVQVLLNMLEFGMNPQQALDQPRFCIGPGHQGPVGAVSLEEGISQEVIDGLRRKGHDVQGPVSGHARAVFGRGHVITKGAWWAPEDRSDVCNNNKVLWAGSDPRTDGLALGY